MEINIVGQFEDNEEIHQVLKIAKVFAIEQRIQNITEKQTKPTIEIQQNKKNHTKKIKTQKNIKLLPIIGLN